MKRVVATVALLLAAACGDDAILPGGGPIDVAFRAISERQNSGMCVRGPAFALALDRGEWQAIWDRQNACQPGSANALPPLVAGEAGLAIWWRVEGCLGYGIKTTRVKYGNKVVTVTAERSTPSGFCATALGGLESFLALDIGAVRSADRIRFMLDEVEVGSLDVPR